MGDHSMRFGRLLLAGLTALAGACWAASAPPPDAHALRVWGAAVPMLVHAAEAVTSAPAAPCAAHCLLALAPVAARHCGSLVLAASLAAVHRIPRRRQPSLLRC